MSDGYLGIPFCLLIFSNHVLQFNQDNSDDVLEFDNLAHQINSVMK